ncbi:uncharacterized protein LOC131576857 [Poecile atricapillus]|uniref:uncharacterized protein LOC131576857 n=1 Tax=Poecile atricapillus TaxID=48891 RepID=UPI002739BA93|nr:uncharacterized protein LOC131576857 [Poecile atricapillus]XP_058689856.1 uncharacterized protein LOC131576857 [Poecile atricapillus]
MIKPAFSVLLLEKCFCGKAPRRVQYSFHIKRVCRHPSKSCTQLRQCKNGRPRANSANHGNSACRGDLGSKCYFTSRKVALKMEYKRKTIFKKRKKVTGRASAASSTGAVTPERFSASSPLVIPLIPPMTPRPWAPAAVSAPPGSPRGAAGSPGAVELRARGMPTTGGAGQGDAGASPLGTPGAASAPLTASRSPPPLEPVLLLTASFCGFRGRREAPGLVRAPRRLRACDGPSRVHSGLLRCPGGVGIPFLFSVAEGFGLFYALFQLWPTIFFLCQYMCWG